MKIVKPNAVYMDPTSMTPYQFLEKCGRTCYKSEDHITENSAVKFVADLAKRKHGAMLEHVYLYLYLDDAARDAIAALPARALKYINFVGGHYLTASFRAMQELLAKNQTGILAGLLSRLQRLYPEVFGEPTVPGSGEDHWTLLKRDEFIAEFFAPYGNPNGLMPFLPHTILFTVDRGVTHELVRHRPASFAQESTRYANYSKGKFGSEITVVEPWWVETDGFTPDGKPTKQYEAWTAAMMAAEQIYIYMTKELGKPAQLARAVLPQSVKADIIVTATETEWDHILNLRFCGTTGAPHPDMRRVMQIAEKALVAPSNGRLQKSELSR